jgi:undecaprenyl-diphosphatase
MPTPVSPPSPFPLRLCMGWTEILLLAIVQGLTEFLPVSSSGHLVVGNALLGAMGYPLAKDLIEVSIALHMGTLASVLVYYRREIARMLGSDRRVIPLLVLATIPAAIVGVGIKKGLSDAVQTQVLDNIVLVGFMLPVTAMILVAGSRRAAGTTEYPQMSWGQALAIGMAQAVAILPGVSRSGTTIAAGLGAGLTRESASTFAFLMAIPAILGAGVLEGLDILEEGRTGTPPVRLAVGFIVSFVVGLAALSLLIQFVKRGKLAMFAWYLIPLGIGVLVWQLGFGGSVATAG